MVQCSYPGCQWRAIAPAMDAARRRYAEHVVAEHSTSVEADLPAGAVQVKLHEDGEWITTTREHARELHDALHDDD